MSDNVESTPPPKPPSDPRERARRAWDNWTDEDRAAETAAWKEVSRPLSC